MTFLPKPTYNDIKLINIFNTEENIKMAEAKEEIKVREKVRKDMRQLYAKLNRLTKHLANYRPKNARAMSNFMGFPIDDRGYNTLTTSLATVWAKNQENSQNENSSENDSDKKRRNKKKKAKTV